MPADIAKLNEATALALAALGRNVPPGARFRLRDIEVDEVSLVDRAANKRTFLVVKNAEAQTMTDEAKETTAAATAGDGAEAREQAEKAQDMIPGPVKEAAVRTVTEAIERLVSVSNMLRDAEETSEEGVGLPSPMADELRKIAELLRGLLDAYPSPRSGDGGEAKARDENAAPEVGPEMAKAASGSGEEPEVAEKAAVPPELLAMIEAAGMEPVALEDGPSELGSEAADKLVAIARAIHVIAEAGSPDEVGAIMAKLAKAAGEEAEGKVRDALARVVGVEAGEGAGTEVEKMDKHEERLARLRDGVRAAGEAFAALEKALGELKADEAGDELEARISELEKRLAAMLPLNSPQGEAPKEGEGNVASNKVDDDAPAHAKAEEGTAAPEFDAVMKRVEEQLARLAERVEKMATVPVAPTSAPEAVEVAKSRDALDEIRRGVRRRWTL